MGGERERRDDANWRPPRRRQQAVSTPSPEREIVHANDRDYWRDRAEIAEARLSRVEGATERLDGLIAYLDRSRHGQSCGICAQIEQHARKLHATLPHTEDTGRCGGSGVLIGASAEANGPPPCPGCPDCQPPHEQAGS